MLLTFDRHPRHLLNKGGEKVALLTSPTERQQIFREIGIDHLVCISFNEELANMEARDFIMNYFVNFLKAKKIIIGYDHRFGKGGNGNFELLKNFGLEHNFAVEEIPALDIRESSVSSTKVRKFLLTGNVTSANQYLGYPYKIRGHVGEGKRIGKSIGFPTANIIPDHEFKLIPAKGVYVVKVKHDNQYYGGMLNIGNRPTINGSNETIEVNIFDFDKNIYGDVIEVEFIKRMREEQKFENLHALKEQLNQDKSKAIQILRDLR